jgi:hypothetical protein
MLVIMMMREARYQATEGSVAAAGHAVSKNTMCINPFDTCPKNIDMILENLSDVRMVSSEQQIAPETTTTCWDTPVATP